MGDLSRGLALLVILVILVGTLIGSILPELGNFISSRFGWHPHTLNWLALFIGIIGICLALRFGFKSGG